MGLGQGRGALVGLAVPFPDKFRLRNRIAGADVRSSELAYTGVRQQLAARTDENSRLAEKLNAARTRLEALLKQIPETES